jgi:hypothetical protein
MADAYKFYGEGAALPYDAPGMAVARKRLDVPDLIANPKLALTSSPNVKTVLPSTGFGAADTLEIFSVQAGVLVRRIGLYVVTGEGATCTIDIGVDSATATHSLAADDDGWAAAFDIETAGVLLETLDSAAFGSDNMPGQLYITDGAVVILFNHATDDAVVDLWMVGEYDSDIV